MGKKLISPERQDEILHLLQDEKLRNVIETMEKDHAITILLLLYAGMGRWGRAKETMRRLGVTLNDGTFRARLLEYEHRAGFANSRHIDPKKKEYIITPDGQRVASKLVDFLEEIAGNLKVADTQKAAR